MNTRKESKERKKEKKDTYANENEVLAKAFITRWNEVHGSKYSAWKPLVKNLLYWKDQYSGEQILTAISNVKHDKFWKNKMTPIIFLRTKNSNREDVDYISQLLQTSNEEEVLII